MSPRATAGRRLGIRLALVVVAGLAFSLALPGASRAQQGPVNLALLPVGQPGSFFDLKMAPGQTRSFAVDIANNGAAEVVTRTYAADVYTIINGGFGARLRDQPETGMTGWLTYQPRVQTLAAGQIVRRTFEVHVPTGAAPGEYITSLVLENDEPIGVQGAVDVNQFIRQAIAVVVTVPGARRPALAIGDASLATVDGQSVVSVAVANTGNIRLSPDVDFTLLDGSARSVARSTFQMGTFYAHTNTFIEVPVGFLLPPGTFVAQLILQDPTGDIRVEQDGSAVVDGTAPLASAGFGQAAGAVVGTPGSGPGSSPALAVLLVAGLLATLGFLVVILVRRPRRRTGSGAGRTHPRPEAR